MSASMKDFNSRKFDGSRQHRKSRFMANREALINESESDYTERLHAKSRKPVNATVPLTATGVILILLGVVLGFAEGSGVYFWVLALCGVGLILLTTITRPLERIHAQLTDINDKLDR